MRDTVDRVPTARRVQTGDLALGLVLAGALWMTAAVLDLVGAGRGTSALDPAYLLMCALVVLAPTLALLPAGVRLGAPGWAVEGIVAWSLLGYLVLFVDPVVIGRGLALALFVPAFTVACASPMLLWRAARGRAGRPRRFAYAAALVPSGLSLIAGAGVLDIANAILVVLLAGAAMMVLWNSARPARSRGALAPRPSPRDGGPRPTSPRATSRAAPTTRLRTATHGT